MHGFWWEVSCWGFPAHNEVVASPLLFWGFIFQQSNYPEVIEFRYVMISIKFRGFGPSFLPRAFFPFTSTVPIMRTVLQPMVFVLFHSLKFLSHKPDNLNWLTIFRCSDPFFALFKSAAKYQWASPFSYCAKLLLQLLFIISLLIFCSMRHYSHAFLFYRVGAL